jgi:hemerythrin-like domain-containing protein
MSQLADAVQLVRTFIGDYHEKLEEVYIFPRFKKAGRLTDLTTVLLQQHQAGRQLTEAIVRQIEQAGNLSDTKPLANNLLAFLRLYRPHAAEIDGRSADRRVVPKVR